MTGANHGSGSAGEGHRGLAAVLVAAAVALAVVLVAVVPAAAHGGEGVIEVGAPEPAGDLTIAIQIRLTFESDGHAAEPDEIGTLTVEGTGPDGAVFPAQEPFTPGDAPGVYGAVLTFPSAGDWELTVTSSEPPASAPVSVLVEEPLPSTTVAGGTTDTTADDAPAADTAGVGQVVEQTDDSSSTTPIVVAMVVCLLLAVGAAVLLRRARARDRTDA